MGTRLDLQSMLEKILGSRNVYYQPPESIKLQYPAIVYSRSDIYNIFANDKPYGQTKAYELTVIDKDPDSKIVDKIADIPMCRYNRHFTSDNLNHDVFILYY